MYYMFINVDVLIFMSMISFLLCLIEREKVKTMGPDFLRMMIFMKYIVFRQYSMIMKSRLYAVYLHHSAHKYLFAILTLPFTHRAMNNETICSGKLYILC